jgi:hypothetical protein
VVERTVILMEALMDRLVPTALAVPENQVHLETLEILAEAIQDLVQLSRLMLNGALIHLLEVLRQKSRFSPVAIQLQLDIFLLSIHPFLIVQVATPL